MKCTELLSQDHAVLRRGLGVLDGMVKKLEDGDRIEIADVTAILKFLRFFGDEYHQTMEEKVLFPALMRAEPQQDSLRQMLVEHGEERAVVAEIEAALNPKKGIAFVRSTRRLTMLLGHHLDKEDIVLREVADRTLSEEQDALVVAEFSRNQTQPETYVNFARLEWKYIRKPSTPWNSGREIARSRGADSYT